MLPGGKEGPGSGALVHKVQEESGVRKGASTPLFDSAGRPAAA